jgi:hypothetical protein
VEHRASSSDNRVATDPHARQYNGAHTEVSGPFYLDFSAYGYGRGEMHIILDVAIVLDDGAGIDDATGSDARTGVDHHSRHDERAVPYAGEAGDGGGRMQQSRQARIERLHALPGIGSQRVGSDGDE